MLAEIVNRLHLTIKDHETYQSSDRDGHNLSVWKNNVSIANKTKHFILSYHVVLT